MSSSHRIVLYGNRSIGIAGTFAKYGTGAIQVTMSVFNNVRRWWNNEISGKRCAKSIVDDSATVGGALVGAAGGALVGAPLGPVGIAIGGVVGGIIGGTLGKNFIQKLTKELFDLPKTEALEKAYNFMGLNHKDSNEKVNARYRELARIYHPDKEGGSEEEFLNLCACVAIIKAARESE